LENRLCGYTHLSFSRLESAGSPEARSHGIVGTDGRTSDSRQSIEPASNQLQLKIQAFETKLSDRAKRVAKERAQQMINATRESSSKVCHNGVISPESKFMQWW
jgi:hypothetical protein